MATGHQNWQRQGWLTSIFHCGDQARGNGSRRPGLYFWRVDWTVQCRRRRQAHTRRPELLAEMGQKVSGASLGFLVLLAVFPQSEKQGAPARTQIVLLGTGTPSPDPERSGPSTAVVVNGTPYLIDFGPGVVRRIAAAAQRNVEGLTVVNTRVAFLTHFHSDHTAG